MLVPPRDFSKVDMEGMYRLSCTICVARSSVLMWMDQYVLAWVRTCMSSYKGIVNYQMKIEPLLLKKKTPSIPWVYVLWVLNYAGKGGNSR